MPNILAFLSQLEKIYCNMCIVCTVPCLHEHHGAESRHKRKLLRPENEQIWGWYQCTLYRKRPPLYYMGLSYVLLLMGLFYVQSSLSFLCTKLYGSILCTLIIVGSYSCT